MGIRERGQFELDLATALTLERPLTREEYLSLTVEEREVLIVTAEKKKQDEEGLEHRNRMRQAKTEGKDPGQIQDERKLPLFMCHWIEGAYKDGRVRNAVNTKPELAAKDERYVDPRCCKYLSTDRFNCTRLRNWLECEEVVLREVE